MLDRFRLPRADLVLAAAAVLGLGLLVGRLPTEHPYASASYALGPDGAVAAARGFLDARGYATDGLEPVPLFLTHTALLDSLQADLGRRATVAALAERTDLPAFYWIVVWRVAEGEDEGRERYAVRLTQTGVPWYFRNRGGAASGGLDPRALDRALGPLGAPAASASDSSLTALLRFDLPLEGATEADLADSLRIRDRARGRAAVTGGQPQTFSAATAVALARTHLEGTLLAPWPLDVAAVAPVPEQGRSAARVTFASAEVREGRRLVAAVDVTAGGALLDLRTRFDVDPEAFEDEPTADGELGNSLSYEPLNSTASTLRVVAWLVLGLVLVGLFVRLLRRRAIDTQASMVDGLVAGLLAAVANLLMLPALVAQFRTSVWEALLLLGINSLFWAVGVGLLVFVASATADSLARTVWPRTIDTLTLVRRGAWLNRKVGVALVRGVALGVTLAGTAAGLLAVFPDTPLGFKGAMPLFGTQYSASNVVLALVEEGWKSFVWIQMGLLGLGTLAMRSGGRGLVLAALVAFCMLVSWVPLTPGPASLPVAWFLAGALGLVLAAAFLRFDALTAGVGLLGARMIGALADGWLIEASPALADVGILAGLFAVALGVGWIGIRRGDAEATPYVPAYLAEMAERERMAHEFNLAREVQQSFLPKQMPEVAGLDFAAACLAAEDVGGDYYDVVRLDARRVGLVIGDVSGKGLHAAFYMTLVKGFVQALWTITAEPSEVLRRLNRFFCANAPKGMFISVICGVFDLDAKTFTFARAGHNPVLHKKAGDTTATPLRPPGLGVGLVTGERFDATITDQTLALAPGDLLVFYTDGVSEAMDRHRHLYGEERLLRLLGEQQKKYAWALLGALVADVRTFAGGEDLHDDMTMVIVRITDALGAPGAAGATAQAVVPLPS